MLDAVIKNSTLYGLEGGGYAATDLGIKDGVIKKIGKIDEDAGRVIDGAGYLTMPGFVDVHSHSDYYLLIDPEAQCKTRQGVTTEIGGNCGYSSAPIGGELLEIRREVFKRQFGLSLDWLDFSEYFEKLRQKKMAVNFAGLIGYNTVRSSVLGLNDAPLTDGKREAMAGAIRDNLSQGAIGLSVGLVYPPACFATKDEMVYMAKEAQKAGKIFATHIRSEGAAVVESIEEVIDIARRSGVRLQISHLKTAGNENWHKLDTVFELIEKARADGIDIECDRYPYTASNTGLQVVLPDWAFDGGKKAVLERLADKRTRERMKEDILKNHPAPEYWDTVMISQVMNENNFGLQGITVNEAASTKNKDVFNFIFDLLLEEETEVEALYFCMNRDNMDRVITKDYVMIGSDAGARGVKGPLAIGRPHPRTFGTFARFFEDYVFGRKLVTIEEAVKKSSTAACERFGIKKRGRLIEGYFADVVMLDPQKVKDTSTYEDPLSYPEGIDYVWVNGALTIDNGEYTSALAGKVMAAS